MTNIGVANLETIVRPGSELKSTFLVVKREVRDVNFARTAQLDRRRPEDDTVVRHHRFTLHRTVAEVFHAARLSHSSQASHSRPN